jgi:hypothetical protein
MHLLGVQHRSPLLCPAHQVVICASYKCNCRNRAVWRSGSSPIQQVCFAQPVESGENLLAVRTTSQVLIFKPILRKAGPNRLQLKLLFEALTADNDDVSFADVAFNPWFPRQFAIIDQTARWRIWEFRSRESSEASCVHSSATDAESVPESGVNDGWARLMWICNPSVILVATRRAVTLHDVTASLSKLQDIDANVSGVSGWALDVAGVPSDPGFLSRIGMVRCVRSPLCVSSTSKTPRISPFASCCSEMKMVWDSSDFSCNDC